MVVDRARTEVELRADLAVGQPVGDEARDLELLRRELAERRRVALPGALTACPQLSARTVLSRRDPEPVERLECGTEVWTSIDPPPLAAQPFAVQQLGARALERREGVGDLECLREVSLRALFVCQGVEPGEERVPPRPRVRIGRGAGERRSS